MKLFHKFFLCFVILFGITFQSAGFLLINFSYENALAQERRYAAQEFQHGKFILQSYLYMRPGLAADEGADFRGIAGNFSSPFAIYRDDGTCVFSNLPARLEAEEMSGLEDGETVYQVCRSENKSHILVGGPVSQDGARLYLVTACDISETVIGQNNMISYFQKIYILLMCIGSPVILLLSGFLARSIGRVGRSARRMAEGNYSERIKVSGSDEVAELARDFNRMAANIEDKMAQLSDQARQKEDFVANFAHELKTPMTSVIGYADMLYQKNLPREEVKSAAGYILNEGMRLEALSLKMMDLFLMDKQDFSLEEIGVPELFDGLRDTIGPICRERGALLHIDMAPGRIRVECDYFTTMILNLVDNSLKADSRNIWIAGEDNGSVYRIRVEDDGKGIPPEELGRITDAFYMVDKSRSRSQHGAGLGMALVSKIAEIHGARLKIASDGMSGTRVYLTFISCGDPHAGHGSFSAGGRT